MSLDDGHVTMTKRWPCGHLEDVRVPSFEDRKELTFHGPDADVLGECSRCKAEREATSVAKARQRERSDARVDKLIDLVSRLVERQQ